MKTYTINLEVLTPVYIGNGSTISKKDFEIKDNYAHIYDPIKLHSVLGILYEGFLINDSCLTDFLRISRHNSRMNIESALKYSAFCGDKSIKKSDGIDEFIKDPYGNPYIPGSSLKGAIRTAILSSMVNENQANKYTQFKKEPISRRDNANKIEEEAFGDIINNKFKSFRISDSAPISKDKLILSKKVDIFKDGESNNKLNLCRESLKPGTKIKFNLTIDDMNNDEDIFTPENIMKSLKEFVNQYRKVYLSKFSSYDNDKYGDDIIYLGGGTGFLTKTINHSLYGDIALEKIASYLDEEFRNHKHRKDVSLGVSPRAKKCTKLKGKTVEMGICRIGIDYNETI